MMALSQEHAALELRLNELHADRSSLVKTAMGLRPETLDVDLVGEYALRMLGRNPHASMIIMSDGAS